MQKVTATFRIVTPMFLGDADQKVSGIRPPSIKGALRFWWRALNWREASNQYTENDDALRWLHDEEARLFGNAASDHGGGQGVFLLNIPRQPKIEKVNDWPKDPLPINGSTYLAFGITKSGSTSKGNFKPHREGIKEGVNFTIELLFRPNTTPNDVEQIIEAVRAFGLLGGLGSRNRRANGSISFIELNGESISYDLQSYQNELAQLFDRFKDVENYPPYTTFSSRSMVKTFPDLASNNPRSAHNSLGNLYKRYRGQESTLRGRDKLPFGIPLPKVSKGEERRASPLFFHIHQLPDNKFLPVAYFLPARFHPNYPQENADLDVFYRVVREFMEERR